MGNEDIYCGVSPIHSFVNHLLSITSKNFHYKKIQSFCAPIVSFNNITFIKNYENQKR